MNCSKKKRIKDIPLNFIYCISSCLPHKNTWGRNQSEKSREEKHLKRTAKQTWTTPLRYILMSIWFFCHFWLDDGSTSLKTEESEWGVNHLSTAKLRLSTGGKISRRGIHFILFLVFIWLQVEHLLQGHIDISDTEQDQGVEHCRQYRERGFKQKAEYYNRQIQIN